MELKDQARKLYEEDGLALIEIANKLDINPNTVRSWKNRQKWKTKSVAQTNGHNPASLANLEKHENFTKGNRAAVKHGLYANNSNQPGYDEYYKAAMDSIGEASQEVFAGAYANFRVALENIEVGNIEYLEQISHVATMVNSAGEKAIRNKLAELEIVEREQRASGTSPIIENIRAMTEGFMDLAREAHTKD